MNDVHMLGTLVRDPEIKETKTGKKVVSFSIARDHGWGDNKKTSFFDCVAWEKTAENIMKNFSKGKRILFSGELEQQRWQDQQSGQNRSRVIINVRRIYFIEKKSEQGNNSGQPEPFSDEDIPF